MKWNWEAYSEPCQTSKIEVFAKTVNRLSFLTIFAKSSILDAWQDSEFASEANNDLRKKLILAVWQGFQINFWINYFRKTIPYLFTKFD